MDAKDTIAVIIAAGLGSRLLPLSDEQPKCMLEVQGKPMLHRALTIFDDVNIDRSVVVGGYKSDKLVLPAGAELVLNDEYMHNNILHSLSYSRPAVNEHETVIVSYSDIIFNRSVAAQLMAEDSNDISIVVDQSWGQRYVGRTLHPLSEAEAAEFDSNGMLLRTGKNLLTPEHDSARFGEFIGMLKLTPVGYRRLWDLFDEIDAKLHSEAPFQQSKEWRRAYLTDLLQEMVDRDLAVHCTLIQGGWLEIDTLQDYETAQSFDFALDSY